MHRTRKGLCWLAAALLGLGGCTTPDKNHLRPPKRPEEYTLPPSDDPRFSEHVRYPKSVLFGDSVKLESSRPQAPGMMGGPSGGMPGGRRAGMPY